MGSQRKKGKWRRCPECGAEIYHHCKSCTVKKAMARSWKCQICGLQCTKHHYQRFCSSCFKSPNNAKIIEEARQERYRRFRRPVEHQDREPTQEEVEATIAAMLPTMPRGEFGQQSVADVQRDDKEMISPILPKPRKRTNWGKRDVLTPLIMAGKGGFTRAMVLADKWLQGLSKKKGRPLVARSFRKGKVIEIIVEYPGKVIKTERFENTQCRNAEKSEHVRKTGGKDSPIYKRRFVNPR